MDENTRLVEIYRAKGLPDAHIVRMRLEELGIPVLIENELLQGVVGELPFGWPPSPRILVGEDQAAAAREALQDHLPEPDRFVSTLAPSAEAAASRSEAECLACGGHLNEAGACATCGWTFETDGEEANEPERELPSLWEVVRRAVGGRPDVE